MVMALVMTMAELPNHDQRLRGLSVDPDHGGADDGGSDDGGSHDGATDNGVADNGGPYNGGSHHGVAHNGDDVLSDVYDPTVLASIDAAALPHQQFPRSQFARGQFADGQFADDQFADDEAAWQNDLSGTSGTAESRRMGRGGLGAASVAGSLWLGALTGVGEALGDEPKRPHVAWYVPSVADPDAEAVSVYLVPGSPAASRVVVRPWLLAGR